MTVCYACSSSRHGGGLRHASRLAGGLAAVVALALGWAGAAAAEAPPARPAPNDYAQPETWTCLPGREDACSKPELGITVVAADGTATRRAIGRNPDAPIDCIYLYPTLSEDPTGNSDMIPGKGEPGAATMHLGPFREVCRTFAPLYRSMTLAAVMGGKPTTPGDPELAYADVRDAWRHYMAHHNGGRGVVLIGLSQGAGLWARLIAEEIDGKPAARTLVSALLLGLPGRDFGGPFKATPPCRRADQLGCFVAFAAYRATRPPVPDSLFGQVGAVNPQVACVNPANLAGGEAPLRAYLPSWSLPPGARWGAEDLEVDTMMVAAPGLLSAKCVRSGRHDYLAVTVHGDPGDPRTDDVAVDFMSGGKVAEGWGLHGMEPSLAMGDLIEIVRAQGAAYQARARE